MLKVRPFIEDQDEPVYVDVMNRSLKEFADFTPLTLGDVEMEKNAPNMDKRGRYVAEWNGVPAGFVYAYLDPLKEDKTGYLDGPYVVPEHRRKHIGSTLAELAFHSYRERGIKKIQASARSANIPAQKFLVKFAFTQCRVFSQMKRSLDNLPASFGENTAIKIIDIGTGDEALKLENELMNESFKEHFNFRALTMEERIYYTREQEKQGLKFNDFVGYLNNQPVGIMITAIDPREIEYKKERVAWLAVLGVLKPYRHQGIGKALMIHAMQFLKKQGVKKAMLGVDDTNITKAIKIYESLGFEVVFKRYMYIKEL
jgi:ribosomal protein S18 acetylase RimI-like enzyme